ncbi:DNA-binding protein [Bifidobacterium rousetti]|uniref:helix-turn-helix domain-containing protein n=1 Tax=Bifidobacterium rousetti TaxID=2045439 RepID=UPI000D4BA60F|nr:helix-turn-helix domain-containing protein [Bifidobacterium rousetti]KAA8815278.1 DNA-binding protein [Bifidobacterium rousetti]PST47607.1 DNA-binding protein [Bifidobacterium callitrichos]
MEDTWLTRKEAAEYSKTTYGTLSTYAYCHKGPRFFKVGGKVLYRKSDLDQWLTMTPVEAVAA